MHTNEMTMSEVLRDPMIRQMLRADRVPLGEFAKLLERTARARNEAYAVEAQAASTARPH
ncbi:hypothetical protein [Rhizobium tubonense]|uniref:Uncharacterized protein n=1 Tax=Rhizobium tubonense TaxID=484088 RepID=A0A2W4CNS4_9HYPH|nr:hypothetical protein [Rhizobium tubonense]PZM14362.1 hypothetical protein CPY51_11305 [Rhizobium tubonense]